MNKIFYIHSNILAICCYHTVKEALAQNEKVIIVTDRNCNWSFFSDRVAVYDLAEIFKGENRTQVILNSIKAVKGYLGYRRYLSHLYDVVNRIVAGEDFVFYLPTMGLDTTVAFAYNQHCKGYYFVEEGTLSYRPKNINRRNISSSIKYTIKRLLKNEDHFPFELNPTFEGTISITNEAFPWNTKKERIVNPIHECVSVLRNSIPLCDDVIVTAWLVEDYDMIIDSIDYAITNIYDNYHNSRIGIKLHPKAITYNREKSARVLQHIKDKYDNRIIIIPNEVSIEIMSLVCHPRLYSLFALSSLILYGLLLKSSEGFLIDNEENITTITRICTIEDYFRLNRIVNYKRI